jgi:hypothetical protein
MSAKYPFLNCSGIVSILTKALLKTNILPAEEFKLFSNLNPCYIHVFMLSLLATTWVSRNLLGRNSDWTHSMKLRVFSHVLDHRVAAMIGIFVCRWCRLFKSGVEWDALPNFHRICKHRQKLRHLIGQTAITWKSLKIRGKGSLSLTFSPLSLLHEWCPRH